MVDYQTFYFSLLGIWFTNHYLTFHKRVLLYYGQDNSSALSCLPMPRNSYKPYKNTGSTNMATRIKRAI